MKVKFRKLCESAVTPAKGSAHAAGFDLTITSTQEIDHFHTRYGFGLSVEIPKGYVGLVFPRSSVYKHGSYGYVTLRGLTPLLGGDGKPLSFSHANVFMCGWGLVKDKKGLFNYIDKRGRFISERWFEAAGPFYECRMGENLKMAVAHVKYNLDSGWALIDGHGAECFDVQRFMCNYDDDTGAGTVGHKK